MDAQQPEEQRPAQTIPLPPTVASFRSRESGGAAVRVPVAAGFNAGVRRDTESDASSIFTDVEETVTDLSLPINSLLEQRQADVDALIVGGRWTLLDPEGQASSGRLIQVVQRPTASSINYRLLHPAVYRYMQPFSELEKVAERLGVFGWEAEADRVWLKVWREFRAFVELDTTHTREREVQSRLASLIGNMACYLNRDCSQNHHQCALVRGTAARDHLVVRGVVDLVFDADGKPILAAEVKTANSWQLTERAWYCKSRAAQLYQTLYAANCPTLLITQQQFRLFWENDDRTRVATFPCEPTGENADDAEEFEATRHTGLNTDALFDTLVVCLMRAPRTVPAVTAMTPGIRLNRTLRNEHESGPATQGRSAADSSASATDTDAPPANEVGGGTAPLAQFFTGVYDANGEPVFRTVHAELVEQFEPDSSCSDSDDASSSCDETPGSSDAVKAVLPTHDSAVAL